MCGIAGILTIRSDGADELGVAVRAMVKSVEHRGPDDSGIWIENALGIALGHRRLSILDLSEAGRQPMQSASGRFIIALNGEIYNHLELRQELDASGAAENWRGHSDTETLLAAFEKWGVEAALQRSVGMFAIALWDKKLRTLMLARDRFGEKPLYYGWGGKGKDRAFLFGSELKAIRAYPGFEAPVCREALAQYMRFSYVPAPRTIYQGLFKLEPGCLLTIEGTPPSNAPALPPQIGSSLGGLSIRRWWALTEKVEAGIREPLGDETEALRLLDSRLSEAVRLQSLADVPLGALLSGGVDSSAIVALMQRQSNRPVKTFTIGFDEAGYDEAPFAQAVARQLGTEHHETRVSAQMARDVIPALPQIYDEPFADTSQIPTHLVCCAARQHVTVALSGDAGDELFGGYRRYLWVKQVWHRLAFLPFPLRRALGTFLSAAPIPLWDAVGGQLKSALAAGNPARVGDKLDELASRLRTVRGMDDLYLNLMSHWQEPARVVVGRDGDPAPESTGPLVRDPSGFGANDDQSRMMYRDSMTYLPDDILCKLDRAAMAASLETRAPFLDHRVAELAWRLPLPMKIRGSQSKWVLRQMLYKHLPRELVDRPKAGFAIPIGAWLRGPLREWAESLLEERRLREQGYLRLGPIRHLWNEHLAGKRTHTQSLWTVLMFQAWLEEEKN